METVHREVANLRRNLPGVCEQAYVEVTPYSIAILCAGAHRALVCESATIVAAYRRMASYRRKIEKWNSASALLLCRLDMSSYRNDGPAVARQWEKLVQ